MNNTITDYDKIVIKCVKESLSLDKGTGNINEFKAQLQNLMVLNQLPNFKSHENDQLLNLITQLYESTNTKSILLFFYKNNCEPSSKFVKEWHDIKNITGNKYKMIAINCEHPKYKQICTNLNVYAYPTIKYIRDGKIIDYLGEMTSDEIIKTFKL